MQIRKRFSREGMLHYHPIKSSVFFPARYFITTFIKMRFFYIFVVAALFAVAYAAAVESVSEDRNPEKSEISQSREKRSILRKKKIAIIGGALIAKKVIAAKVVVGAGVLGAGALGAAGLAGAKLYQAKQGASGGGYGGGYGGGHGGYQSASSVTHNYYPAQNSVYGSSGPGWASASGSSGYGSSGYGYGPSGFGLSARYGTPGWSG